MTNNDLKQIRGVVKEGLQSALNPVDKKLKNLEKKTGSIDEKVGGIDEKIVGLEKKTEAVERKLDILWEQVEKNTIDLEQIKDNVQDVKGILISHADKSDDNTEKLNKRVKFVEGNLGISPPPELSI